MASFTERLKTLRKQKNFSQQELADKIQVTKQTVSQYERGIRKPDYNTLLFLCDLFNVSADYLLGKADVTIRLLNEKELAKLSDQNDITESEQELIDNYRLLNNDGKKIIHMQMNMMLKEKSYIKDTESQNEEII